MVEKYCVRKGRYHARLYAVVIRKSTKNAHHGGFRHVAKMDTLKNLHGSTAPLASRRHPRGRNANLAGLNRAPMYCQRMKVYIARICMCFIQHWSIIW